MEAVEKCSLKGSSKTSTLGVLRHLLSIEAAVVTANIESTSVSDGRCGGHLQDSRAVTINVGIAVFYDLENASLLMTHAT